MANLIFLGQNWAWPPCAQYSAPGVRNPLKSSVMGPSFLVNCYLEIGFHKKIRLKPSPDKMSPNFKTVDTKITCISRQKTLKVVRDQVYRIKFQLRCSRNKEDKKEGPMTELLRGFRTPSAEYCAQGGHAQFWPKNIKFAIQGQNQANGCSTCSY